VEEAPSYGTPGFRVRKKLLARMHQSEDALVLLLRDIDEQEALIEMDPSTFYITDHYRGYAAVLAKLSAVKQGQILDIVEAAWRRVASKAQIEEFDQE
jgi:hypothetical protein